MITIIAAVSDDGYIGKDGKLPWHIPEDLRRFKKLTTGKTVVMGRKTWESLPIKPLPNRRNRVLTRNPKWQAEGAEVLHSLEDAIEAMSGDVFIIGGESVYREAMRFADVLEITEVHQNIEGDAKFPKISNEWEEIKRIAFQGFEFVKYVRRRK